MTAPKQDLLRFFNLAIQEVPTGFIALKADGSIMIINQRAASWLGIAEHQNSSSLNLYKLLPENSMLSEKIKSYQAQPKGAFLLLDLLHHKKYLNIRGRILDETMLITIEDITSRKQEEQEALQALLEASEIEKRKISREVHDGIGPLLSALKLEVEALEVVETDAAKREKLFDIYNMVDVVHTDLRQISHELMPRALEDFGLKDALDQHCARLNSSKRVTVQFYSNIHHKRYDRNIELNLYRIALELIQNALKHAKAQFITVQMLEHQKAELVLTVEDDGIGFDLLDTARVNGIGMVNIESRVAVLEGEVFYEAQTGRGVLATVIIPLN